jgi:hypothetical protein
VVNRRVASTLSLPATLPGAVRVELRRALHPPYDAPVVVLANGLLVALCWTLLPPAAVDAVFRFHGPLAFAMVLAMWMYADVPVTNLLGGDSARSVVALDDPGTLRRLWYAKNMVLWLLVTPVCTVTAIAIGVHERQPVAAALTVLWIALVPLGALGFAAWLGIWYPYHPLPLRYRWARRRRWRPMLVRWTVLVLVPYALVPLLATVVVLPSLLLWYALTGGGRVNDAQFGGGLLLAAAIAVVAWLVGHWYGPRLANRRREWLAAFLTDPDRG